MNWLRPLLRADALSTLKSIFEEQLYSNDLLYEGRKTLLEAAIGYGADQTAAHLIERGVDVNVRSIGGYSPLLLAVRMQKSDIVSQLLGAGADINQASAGGYTPVMVALYKRDEELAMMLVREGCDLLAVTRSGFDVLLCAVSNRCYQVARAALDAGAVVDNTKMGYMLWARVNGVWPGDLDTKWNYQMDVNDLKRTISKEYKTDDPLRRAAAAEFDLFLSSRAKGAA